MLDLPPCDFFSFRPKFDKNAGLTPCYFFSFRPKFDKMLDLLNPCDFFSFRPKLDKGNFSVFDPNLIKMLDIRMVIFQFFRINQTLMQSNHKYQTDTLFLQSKHCFLCYHFTFNFIVDTNKKYK